MGELERMTKKRLNEAKRSVWVGLAGHASLTVLQGLAGYAFDSMALLAGAVYSACETAGSIAVLTDLKHYRLTGKQARSAGGKAESVGMLVAAVALIFVGIQIAISAARRILEGAVQVPRTDAAVAAAGVILLKAAIMAYKRRAGKIPVPHSSIGNSPGTQISSLIILAGTVGAIVGTYAKVPSLVVLDPIAAVAVAVLIVLMGYRLIMEAVNTPAAPPINQEDTEALHQAARRVKGVIAVEQLIAREQGHYVVVEMKICVNPRITVWEGQEIGKQVKQLLMERFTHLSDVSVQVNPYDSGVPYKSPDTEEDERPQVLH